MEIQALEPHRLRGWHVVEAGRRQAWPFLQLADPSTGRELRIYVDTDFSVLPRFSELNQDDDRGLAALDSLMGLTVTAADKDDAALTLVFKQASFVVASADNHLTTHAPWWFGRPAEPA